jgi:hypothetical protein
MQIAKIYLNQPMVSKVGFKHAPGTFSIFLGHDNQAFSRGVDTVSYVLYK